MAKDVQERKRKGEIAMSVQHELMAKQWKACFSEEFVKSVPENVEDFPEGKIKGDWERDAVVKSSDYISIPYPIQLHIGYGVCISPHMGLYAVRVFPTLPCPAEVYKLANHNLEYSQKRRLTSETGTFPTGPLPPSFPLAYPVKRS
jgi:hypothetical protein